MESVTRRLHSQDKPAPLPQKGEYPIDPTARQMKGARLVMQIPLTHLGTDSQDTPNVKVELESRGSSMMFWLKTAQHLVSLISKSSTQNYN